MYLISESAVNYDGTLFEIDKFFGVPVAATADKKRAEQMCEKLNLEVLPGKDIYEYGENLKDLTHMSRTQLKNFLPFLQISEEKTLRIPETITPADLKKVYDAFSKIRFYFVSEVQEV